tara:strand:- start:1797 stop:2207 length:411 start_codon:yes stop_codon:yes gene_type:complete
MDLTSTAIKNLERLKSLRKRRLDLETWDVSNEISVGNNRELPIYNLRRRENVMSISENIIMVKDIIAVLKHINTSQQIKIPLESKFASRAQGATISSACLPSGFVMYDAVDDYEWVVRGNYAVLEQPIVEPIVEVD